MPRGINDVQATVSPVVERSRERTDWGLRVRLEELRTMWR